MTPLGARIDALATNADQLNATIGAIERTHRQDGEKARRRQRQGQHHQPAASSVPAAVPVPVPEASANGVPAGVHQTGLQAEAAQRDYQGGNDDLALTELSDYVKYWNEDAWAPTAGYVDGP